MCIPVGETSEHLPVSLPVSACMNASIHTQVRFFVSGSMPSAPCNLEGGIFTSHTLFGDGTVVYPQVPSKGKDEGTCMSFQMNKGQLQYANSTSSTANVGRPTKMPVPFGHRTYTMKRLPASRFLTLCEMRLFQLLG